ncbi:SAV_915 family protein [Actinomadura rugatobispora]|uniref:SAV_915 family protein n=1 Tax=Actinomadura rugatobispora TaxID=1994 RepID=A0ABW0ZSI9_9ACTN|nr:hypothetical protein GCM10010200_111270 [Actinomadura rugatobispora]
MHELLIVPVHVCTSGTVVLRTGLLSPRKKRVGIAFTSEEGLRSALGEGQRSIRLSVRALRAMLRPMGIADVQVDPLFVGPELPAAPSAPRPVPTLAGHR